MSAQIESAVGEQIQRLRVLWPVLNSRDQHTQEIVAAVMRHAHRITADDVRAGFDEAIEGAPTSGWPPGPHEVIGCVLAARERRVGSTHTPRRFGGGLTFAQWWHTLGQQERGKHSTLRRMMERRGVYVTDHDEITWEDAA